MTRNGSPTSRGVRAPNQKRTAEGNITEDRRNRLLKALGGFTLLLTTLLSIAGCTFRHREFEVTPPINKGYELHTLQVNDYGEYWSPDNGETVLGEIASATEKKNAIVLVYAHGWHHNARESKKSNLRRFKGSLSLLADKLQGETYQKVRKNLTEDDAIRVIGVYIGWRGRSLPGWLDFLTVWPRQSASKVVGRGDVREFLFRLDKLYEARNTDDSRAFMGLVSVGHSLGGQLLFSAVAENIESQLLDATSTDLASREHTPCDSIDELPFVLKGIGDLTVLINPALEAHQYERIDRLTKQLGYCPQQTPVLMVVSGEKDWARQLFFPPSRFLAQLLKPKPKKERRKLWRQALGEHKPQRTHTLKKTGSNTPSLTEAVYIDDKGCPLLPFDFSDRVELGKAILEPSRLQKTPFTPTIVAYTDGKLIKKHSGIFGHDFADFLTDYVAFIEGKRMVLGAIQREGDKCDNPDSGNADPKNWAPER